MIREVIARESRQKRSKVCIIRALKEENQTRLEQENKDIIQDSFPEATGAFTLNIESARKN